MESKKQKKAQTSSDWKKIVQVFVGDVLARVTDNVNQKVHVWMKNFKRRAIGSVLMLLGATYFLTGLSDYVSSLFGKDFPGFGSGLVGLAVVAIGYLMSRDLK
ncbi:MAG: hypothetical protein ACD_56C00123G0006 [uncultured bacterium]|nr:MAG: hypothetical protein ACD_56C00123G0006 [uncultured bacterium]